MSPGDPFSIRSKGQRSRSQVHIVQKHISGDRVAGVSLQSFECPESIVTKTTSVIGAVVDGAGGLSAHCSSSSLITYM